MCFKDWKCISLKQNFLSNLKTKKLMQNLWEFLHNKPFIHVTFKKKKIKILCTRFRFKCHSLITKTTFKCLLWCLLLWSFQVLTLVSSLSYNISFLDLKISKTQRVAFIRPGCYRFWYFPSNRSSLNTKKICYLRLHFSS